MNEQIPKQLPDIKVSSNSDTQELIAKATPEVIYKALDSDGGYWDDFDERCEQFDAIKHTLSPEEARRQSNKFDLEENQARGMTYALDAWKTHLSRGDTEESFDVYVTRMAEELDDNARKGISQAEEPAALFDNAKSWNRNHLSKVMGEYYRNQTPGELASNKQERQSYVEPSTAERQAQAEQDQQESSRRQLEEKAENAQREVATTEARQSLEAIREEGELAEVIVKLGKNATYVNAPHERGGTNYGTMDRDTEKKINNQIHKSSVTFAFGAQDYNGQVRKPENVDWREAGVGERVSFIPVIEQEMRTETRTELVEKKRFGKDVTREVASQFAIPGSERQKIVLNPETGQQEEAILFTYDFNPTVLGNEASEAISYREFAGGRLGAFLSVALELPKSVADKLLARIEEHPEYVREVAEALVLSNTGGIISEEDWRKGGPNGNGSPVRPPYERVHELAPNWQIAIATPKPGADISSFANGRKGENFNVIKLKI